MLETTRVNVAEVDHGSPAALTPPWPISDVAKLSDRRRIVAVVPRGEVIRNFLYSGIFAHLHQQADLTLLSVVPTQEVEELLRSNCHAFFPLSDIKETRVVRTQREILEMAHGRWLWSEAARERWRLRDLEADTPQLRLKRLAKKISCYPFASRRGLRVLSKIERTSSRLLRTTDHYVRLFENLQPSLVFNGSHVHSLIAAQAVQAAQWLKIPTATFIFSWDNLTSQGRILTPYDYYLVWNDALKEQLLEIYDNVSPDQVFVTGSPQFDFHFKPEFRWTREEFCHRVGADPARPIVLYTTGMPNHMPDEPMIVEGIADLLKGMSEFGPPQLLVRIYPKDLSGRFDDLKVRRGDILFPHVKWEQAWLTPKYDDAFDLTNALLHCALGINVASTVSLELCMFDKPVINIGYNPPSVDPGVISYRRYYDFDHYRPLVAGGAVALAESESQLRELLHQALAEPQRRAAERLALLKNMFGETLDGDSGNRVIKHLLSFAAGASSGND